MWLLRCTTATHTVFQLLNVVASSVREPLVLEQELLRTLLWLLWHQISRWYCIPDLYLRERKGRLILLPWRENRYFRRALWTHARIDRHVLFLLSPFSIEYYIFLKIPRVWFLQSDRLVVLQKWSLSAAVLCLVCLMTLDHSITDVQTYLSPCS